MARQRRDHDNIIIYDNTQHSSFYNEVLINFLQFLLQ